MSQSTIKVTYRIETAGDVAALAAKIASDQSTGTFVEVPGETPELKARVAARVVDIRMLEPVATPSFPEAAASSGGRPYQRGDADIEFPLEAVGTDLAALMTIAIGGVFSIKGFSGIRVVDMKLPPEFQGAHPGPQFGVEGSRKLTGIYRRPIIGTIVKPALGLRPHETAALVRELVEADVDFIKDDEKLASPAYSNLADRVKAIMPIILDREQKTGKKVMYAFGISHADPEQMARNHDIVADAGGNAAVVNINSVGFGGFSFLRKRSRLALHAHRNGWDILTRHPGLGMDFRVYQQFWRLLGVDQFQINGIGAKYWEPDESFVRSFEALTKPLFSPRDCPMPVAGSGQWGGQAPETFERTERTLDLLYLCGGGIVSHPGGPAAGVRAVRQAWEAAVAGVPLATYAREHRELAQSIAKFGGKASDA
ncbi:3-oxo-isoapionate-4-phosphate decarboxylase OiaX [Methylocapsa sp. S129]|uniref:3-oxo-isoapionate-4-phosphate decarboxylase OiaX n=1 Tax=Methylocapsa sp. S129 TaxID=1641869 RepID=UPI00131C8FA5|nr:3-oxo-isoapionate-4-phosphate decarboxylase OiaX [Methylocapsa sp. S129]